MLFQVPWMQRKRLSKWLLKKQLQMTIVVTAIGAGTVEMAAVVAAKLVNAAAVWSG
jgi:hypothetical protein